MQESLFTIEEYFQNLLRFAPTAMLLTNPDGAFIQSNTAFQELLGYTEEELKTLSFFEVIHPEDRIQNIDFFSGTPG